MILVIGLGNIGNQYTNTKHNVGFITVDEISENYDFPNWKEKPKYFYTKSKIDDIEVILAKPKTYMNLSGEAVMSLSTLYKILPEDIIVIHDDLDVKLGEIRTKQGGGNAGHNGLKSIDSHIGKDYHRIRVGISHPKTINPAQDVSSYVLSKFTKKEIEVIVPAIEKISTNFGKIIKKDLSTLT